MDPCSSRRSMKVPCLLLVTWLLTASASAQSSFSPLSLLNSWLSSVPGWPLPPGPAQARPHHQRSAGLSSSSVQTKQKQKFFRPHLKLSPSISSPQNVPTIVRLPPSLPSSSPFPSSSSPIIKTVLTSSSSISSPPAPVPVVSSSGSGSGSVFIGSHVASPSVSSVSGVSGVQSATNNVLARNNLKVNIKP